MARSCSICKHAEREAIDLAIVSNEKYQEISKRFDISISAIGRHKENHLKTVIRQVEAERKEQIAQVVEEAEEKREQFVWNLFAEMQWLHEEVRTIYELAKGSGDYGASSKALGEARQQMKLFSELLKGMEPGQAEKLEQEWIAVREAIFQALESYPEARLAVAEALFALNKGNHDYESGGQLLEAAPPDNVC